MKVRISVDGLPLFSPGDVAGLRDASDIVARILSVQIYDSGQTTYTVSWIANGDRKVETLSEFELVWIEPPSAPTTTGEVG